MEVGERARLEEVMAKLDQAMNRTAGPGFSSLRLYDAATGRAEEEEPDCFTWNYYNSVFFCFTAVTTIGELI